MTEEQFQGMPSNYSLSEPSNSFYHTTETQPDTNYRTNGKGPQNGAPKVLLSCELCRQRKVKCEKVYPGPRTMGEVHPKARTVRVR